MPTNLFKILSGFQKNIEEDPEFKALPDQEKDAVRSQLGAKFKDFYARKAEAAGRSSIAPSGALDVAPEDRQPTPQELSDRLSAKPAPFPESTKMLRSMVPATALGGVPFPVPNQVIQPIDPMGNPIGSVPLLRSEAAAPPPPSLALEIEKKIPGKQILDPAGQLAQEATRSIGRIPLALAELPFGIAGPVAGALGAKNVGTALSQTAQDISDFNRKIFPQRGRAPGSLEEAWKFTPMDWAMAVAGNLPEQVGTMLVPAVAANKMTAAAPWLLEKIPGLAKATELATKIPKVGPRLAQVTPGQIGAFLGATGQEVSEIGKGQVERTGELHSPVAALGTGAIAGSLESIVPARLESLYRSGGGDALRKAAQAGFKSAAKYLGKDVLQNATEEGITETLQTLVEAIGSGYGRNMQDLDRFMSRAGKNGIWDTIKKSPLVMETIFSGMMGALGGATFGGGITAANLAAERLDSQPASPAPTPPAPSSGPTPWPRTGDETITPEILQNIIGQFQQAQAIPDPTRRTQAVMYATTAFQQAMAGNLTPEAKTLLDSLKTRVAPPTITPTVDQLDEALRRGVEAAQAKRRADLSGLMDRLAKARPQEQQQPETQPGATPPKQMAPPATPPDLPPTQQQADQKNLPEPTYPSASQAPQDPKKDAPGKTSEPQKTISPTRQFWAAVEERYNEDDGGIERHLITGAASIMGTEGPLVSSPKIARKLNIPPEKATKVMKWFRDRGFVVQGKDKKLRVKMLEGVMPEKESPKDSAEYQRMQEELKKAQARKAAKEAEISGTEEAGLPKEQPATAKSLDDLRSRLLSGERVTVGDTFYSLARTKTGGYVVKEQNWGPPMVVTIGGDLRGGGFSQEEAIKRVEETWKNNNPQPQQALPTQPSPEQPHAVAKEGWQKTFAEYSQWYRDQYGPGFNEKAVREMHRDWIRRAISEGKLVPTEVMAEYPDLRASIKPMGIPSKLEQLRGIMDRIPTREMTPEPASRLSAQTQQAADRRQAPEMILPTARAPMPINQEYQGSTQPQSQPGEPGDRIPSATAKTQEPTPPSFNPAQAIKLVADSVDQLRPQDIYRLLSENPDRVEELSAFIRKNHRSNQRMLGALSSAREEVIREIRSGLGQEPTSDDRQTADVVPSQPSFITFQESGAWKIMDNQTGKTVDFFTTNQATAANRAAELNRQQPAKAEGATNDSGNRQGVPGVSQQPAGDQAGPQPGGSGVRGGTAPDLGGGSGGRDGGRDGGRTQAQQPAPQPAGENGQTGPVVQSDGQRPGRTGEAGDVGSPSGGEVFRQDLQKLRSGSLPTRIILRLGRPGNVLLRSGFPDAEIEITQSVIQEKMAKHPEITWDVLGMIPESLLDPIMVFPSRNNPKSKTVLTELKAANGNNVVIGIDILAERKRSVVNDILTVFGRSGEGINDWFEMVGNGIIKPDYINQEKQKAWQESYIGRISSPSNPTTPSSPNMPQAQTEVKGSTQPAPDSAIRDWWWKELTGYGRKMATNKASLPESVAKKSGNNLTPEEIEALRPVYEADFPAVEPAAPTQPQAPAPQEFGSKNTVFTKEAADKARAILRKKLGQVNMNAPLDPETVQAGIQLAGYYIEGGARTFAQTATKLLQDLGAAAKPYLRSWYAAVAYYPGFDNSGMDMPGPDLDREAAKFFEKSPETGIVGEETTPTAPAQEPQPGPTPETPEEDVGKPGAVNIPALARSLVGYIEQNFTPGQPGKKMDNRTLKKFVAEKMGVPMADLDGPKYSHKITQEAFESALVLYIRKNNITDAGTLTELYQAQPNLAVRTGKTVTNQAYSTPVNLVGMLTAAIAPQANQTVYEPTAGNGLLVSSMPNRDGSGMVLNEIDPIRRETLTAAFPRAIIFDQDATEDIPVAPVDLVVANPPFGTIPQRAELSTVKGASRTFPVSKLEYLIAWKALEKMKDSGRAVLLFGAEKEPTITGAQKSFMAGLYNQYNVVGHFEVDGDLYSRQGARWPVTVVVIDGRRNFVSGTEIRPPESVTRHESWQTVADATAAIGREIANGTSTQANSTQETQESRGPGTRGDAVRRGQEPAGDGKPDFRPGQLPTGRSGSQVEEGQKGERPGLPRSEGQVGPGELGGTSEQSGAGPELSVQPGPVLPSPDVSRGQADGRGRGPQADREAELGRGRRPERGVGRSEGGNTGGADSSPGSDVVNELQARYSPRSSGQAGDNLIPVNLKNPIDAALRSLEDQEGKTVDEFVANELGVSIERLQSFLSAEQVDAVALAINAAKSGAAIINADQTGVGKGRTAAVMIQWARKNGMVPVFFTEKPGLFSDMYRDLLATGGGNLRPFIFNADGTVQDANGDEVSRPEKGQKQKRVLERMAAGDYSDFEPGGKFDFIELTYSQVSSEKYQDKRRALLGGKNIFPILDEAHNSAGEESNTSLFIREILGSAPGAYYLSATWAKRPESMIVYMKALTGDPDDLMAAFENGGVGMQELMVATMAASGRYIRREQDFSDVSWHMSRTDEADIPTERYVADETMTAVRGILAFAQSVNGFLKDNHDDAAGMVPIGTDIDTKTRNEVEKSLQAPDEFSSVHNFVEQLLSAVKAKRTAQRAIEMIKAGQKPVIAIRNTMESKMNELEPSDLAAFSGTYKDLLKVILKKAASFTAKDPMDSQKRITIRIPYEEMTPEMKAAFDEAMQIIDDADIPNDLPFSPIDFIQSEIQKAGFTVGEITGRTKTLDYLNAKPGSPPALVSRLASDLKPAGKNAILRAFNDGGTDALLINESGAVGLSAHSSTTFKDQRQRTMLIIQPLLDINKFMQILGRIHRKGAVTSEDQVTSHVPGKPETFGFPYYEYIQSGMEMELRPASALQNKMKSLNAQTSSNQKGHQQVATTDIFNKYGKQVAQDWIEANQEVGDAIQAYDEGGDKIRDNVDADFVARRISVLPQNVQVKFWSEVPKTYARLIEYLDSIGKNDLAPISLKEAEAKTLQAREAQPAIPPNPPVMMETNEITVKGNPTTLEDAEKDISDLDMDRLQEAEQAFDTFIQVLEKKNQENVGKQGARGFNIQGIRAAKAMFHNAITETYKPGTKVRLIMGEGDSTEFVPGVVSSVKIAKPAGGNPFNPSNITFRIAAPKEWGSLNMTIDLFLSKSQPEGSSALNKTMFQEDWARFYDESKTRRETRTFLTGDVVRASRMHGSRNAKVVQFQREDGSFDYGWMMPRTFEASSLRAPPVVMTPELAVESMRANRPVSSPGGTVVFRPDGSILVKKSKKGGKAILGDEELKRILGKSEQEDHFPEITRGPEKGYFRETVESGSPAWTQAYSRITAILSNIGIRILRQGDQIFGNADQNQGTSGQSSSNQGNEKSFFVPIVQDGKTTFRQVDGTPVVIPGFEEFDLFVAKPADGRKSWIVSEGKTGLGITKAMDTREDAIAEATKTLQRMGAEKFKSLVNDAKTNGSAVSPRWKGRLKSETGPLYTFPGNIAAYLWKKWDTKGLRKAWSAVVSMVGRSVPFQKIKAIIANRFNQAVNSLRSMYSDAMRMVRQSKLGSRRGSTDLFSDLAAEHVMRQSTKGRAASEELPSKDARSFSTKFKEVLKDMFFRLASEKSKEMPHFQRALRMDPTGARSIEELENKLSQDIRVSDAEISDSKLREHIRDDNSKVHATMSQIMDYLDSKFPGKDFTDLREWTMREVRRVLKPFLLRDPVQQYLFRIAERIYWNGQEMAPAPGFRMPDGGSYTYEEDNIPGQIAMLAFRALPAEYQKILTDRAKANEEYRQNYINVFMPWRTAQTMATILRNSYRLQKQRVSREIQRKFKVSTDRLEALDDEELASIGINRDDIRQLKNGVVEAKNQVTGEIPQFSKIELAKMEAEIRDAFLQIGFLETDRGHFGYVHRMGFSGQEEMGSARQIARVEAGKSDHPWFESVAASQKRRPGAANKYVESLVLADIKRAQGERRAELINRWMETIEDAYGFSREYTDEEGKMKEIRTQEQLDEANPWGGYSVANLVKAKFGKHAGRFIFLPDEVYERYKAMIEEKSDYTSIKDVAEAADWIARNSTYPLIRALLYHPAKMGTDLISAPMHLAHFLMDFPAHNTEDAKHVFPAIIAGLKSMFSPGEWNRLRAENWEYSESAEYNPREDDRHYITKGVDYLGNKFFGGNLPIGSLMAAFFGELDLAGAGDLPIRRFFAAVAEDIARRKGLTAAPRERFVRDLVNQYAFDTKDNTPLLKFLRGKDPSAYSKVLGVVQKHLIPFMGYITRLGKQITFDPFYRGIGHGMEGKWGQVAADMMIPAAWATAAYAIAVMGLIPGIGGDDREIAGQLQNRTTIPPDMRVHGRIKVGQTEGPDASERYLRVGKYGHFGMANSILAVLRGKSSVGDLVTELASLHPAADITLAMLGKNDPYDRGVPMESQLGTALAMMVVPQLARIGPDFAKAMSMVFRDGKIPDRKKQKFLKGFLEAAANQLGVPVGDIRLDVNNKPVTYKFWSELFKTFTGINVKDVPLAASRKEVEKEASALEELLGDLKKLKRWTREGKAIKRRGDTPEITSQALRDLGLTRHAGQDPEAAIRAVEDEITKRASGLEKARANLKKAGMEPKMKPAGRRLLGKVGGLQEIMDRM